MLLKLSIISLLIVASFASPARFKRQYGLQILDIIMPNRYRVRSQDRIVNKVDSDEIREKRDVGYAYGNNYYPNQQYYYPNQAQYYPNQAQYYPNQPYYGGGSPWSVFCDEVIKPLKELLVEIFEDDEAARNLVEPGTDEVPSVSFRSKRSPYGYGGYAPNYGYGYPNYGYPNYGSLWNVFCDEFLTPITRAFKSADDIHGISIDDVENWDERIEEEEDVVVPNDSSRRKRSPYGYGGYAPNYGYGYPNYGYGSSPWSIFCDEILTPLIRSLKSTDTDGVPIDNIEDRKESKEEAETGADDVVPSDGSRRKRSPYGYGGYAPNYGYGYPNYGHGSYGSPWSVFCDEILTPLIRSFKSADTDGIPIDNIEDGRKENNEGEESVTEEVVQRDSSRSKRSPYGYEGYAPNYGYGYPNYGYDSYGSAWSVFCDEILSPLTRALKSIGDISIENTQDFEERRRKRSPNRYVGPPPFYNYGYDNYGYGGPGSLWTTFCDEVLTPLTKALKSERRTGDVPIEEEVTKAIHGLEDNKESDIADKTDDVEILTP